MKLKYIPIIFFLFPFTCFSQSVWDDFYDNNPKWISLVEQYFGSDFDYIGTRNLEGPPQVLFLDRESIVKKGKYLESTFYQITMEENNEDGGGVFMKINCDCENFRMYMTYFGTMDGKLGEEQNDGWKTGIGDGLAGRIVASVCNPRNEKFEYIDLVKSNGVYYVPVTINNLITRSFVLDSGAADLYISKQLGDELKGEGILRKSNFSRYGYYEDASGNISKNEVYTINEISLGKRILRNIECAISDKEDISLLLGQSLLEKLGKYEIDYGLNQLIIK